MAAPISSAVAARSNGSGLKTPRQFPVGPVPFPHQVDQAFGCYRSGTDRHHADAVAHADTAGRQGAGFALLGSSQAVRKTPGA
jgi:hypothetical protein